MKKILTAAVIAGFASIAMAHDGVMNDAVKTRMDTMVEFKDAMKILGRMGSGADAWDAAKIESTIAAVQAAAARVAPEFETEENDPKDKAADAIWTNWDDFAAKSDALVSSANALDMTSAETLGTSVQAFGKTCSACHRVYRERN